ncbi:MAG: hypothetical protein U0M12_09060 [Acutalibacteraceae bacterium]|nr:hypothetical protein [Acutalibacteraceae bacterium]
MYKYRAKDFILFKQPQVTVNKTAVSLNEFSEYSCYMDEIYPLFSTKSSIRKLVLKGIRKNNLEFSPDDIKELYFI